MLVNHRPGCRAGGKSGRRESLKANLSTGGSVTPCHGPGFERDGELVDTAPAAAASLVTVTALLAVLTPPVLLVAVVCHFTVLGLVGTAACTLLFGSGCLACAWRRRHLRWQLDRALHDPVTGLPTRMVAEDALDAATARGTRLTVALADVDGLRAVNNGLGHAAGDQLLRAVADRLSRAVPAGGLLARLGGDEFVMLAPGADPADLATAIGAVLAGPATIAGHRMQPRASVGMAATDNSADQFADQFADPWQALARADAAMYTAKDTAGMQILRYDPRRDGEPARDGTRPLVRRRDRRPTSTDALNWTTPSPGDQLVPVLWNATDLTTIHTAVAAARDGSPTPPSKPTQARISPTGRRKTSKDLGVEMGNVPLVG